MTGHGEMPFRRKQTCKGRGEGKGLNTKNGGKLSLRGGKKKKGKIKISYQNGLNGDSTRKNSARGEGGTAERQGAKVLSHPRKPFILGNTRKRKATK